MNHYYSELSSFTEEKWSYMSVDDKLKALQAVENEVADREGREACHVRGEYIPSSEDGITLGYYSENSREITINTEQLQSQSEYGDDYATHLDTILHEGRHAYQHQVVSGEVTHANTTEVQEWTDNMAPGHYISYERNPRAYYSQPIERDARSFAASKAVEVERDKRNYLELRQAAAAAHPQGITPKDEQLMESGLQNVEVILEARRDAYRDSGMTDGPEMEQIIDRERTELVREFARDAFPQIEQDYSIQDNSLDSVSENLSVQTEGYAPIDADNQAVIQEDDSFSYSEYTEYSQESAESAFDYANSTVHGDEETEQPANDFTLQDSNEGALDSSKIANCNEQQSALSM